MREITVFSLQSFRVRFKVMLNATRVHRENHWHATSHRVS